jgi:hypothetical protein
MIFCMPPSLCSFSNFYDCKISTFPHTPKYSPRFFLHWRRIHLSPTIADSK